MKIPKPLMISLILYGMAFLVQSILTPWMNVLFIEDLVQRANYVFWAGITSVVLNLLAPAVWVCFEAKKKNVSALFWGLLVFFTGTIGLVLFYAYHYFQEAKKTE